MGNQQIKLLLNKWEEIHTKLITLNSPPIQVDFFEKFERDMLSFLREFYRLRELETNNIEAIKQHLKYSEESEIDNTNNSEKKEQKISSNEEKNENSYPDIQFYFSLNDKFYFLREIFNGNTTDMNHIISILNRKTSLNDSLKYMEKELLWDIENPTIIKLISIIEKRFDNKKIWESYL